MRGGRVKDLPGVKYKALRGKLDFIAKEVFQRNARRSKFSIKNPSKHD